jgi:hypothetical protein
VLEYGEGVRPDLRKERLGRPVEELNRCDVRLEVAMVHQLLDSSGIGHESARLILIPQAVGVADAVSAAERAPLDVIQGQAALAVLDHVTGAVGQAIYLVSGQKRDECTHVVLSQSPRVDILGRVSGSVQS